MKIAKIPSSEAVSLIVLTLVSACVGLLTGLVAATFRVGLDWAAKTRLLLHEWGQSHPYLGFPVFLAVCVTCVVLAAVLVKRIEPAAEGSGIPRVEAIVEGRLGPGRSRILPVKFIGGLLAIGPGMMLGREGPLVQMGGNVASTINKIVKLDKGDLRVLVGAGAAAGLATAFNAPIAGGVFVLEELTKRFDVKSSLATLTASATGFVTSMMIVGNGTDFRVGTIPAPALMDIHWTILVGIVCGLMGIAYNWYVMFCLYIVDRILTVPVEIRAGVIGLIIAILGWYSPEIVGGGDYLTQEALFAHGDLNVALGILLIRFVMGPICYAGGTPGGLFAPMLVLGSTAGELVGFIAQTLNLTSVPAINGLAIVGMAAFFAATVRAPVTGLILAAEMTGSTTMLPPMLGACAVAMLIATAARSEPIYEQLAHRAEQAERFQKVISYVRVLPSTAKQVGSGIQRITLSGKKVIRGGSRAQQVKRRAENEGKNIPRTNPNVQTKPKKNPPSGKKS
ncbi:ClC family H(+)/Cl(-) exchange transporter [Actinomycetaceae bacterium TAE3-ERU4]|nr:ClC family H(+)/Cl(-) exchange transporter [Actinomycetaceae bacterium TAE3-ERU4]